MNTRMKKTMSLVLVLCLLLSAVPVTVLAAEEETPAVPELSAEPEQSVTQAEPAAPETAEEVTVLWEDETLRGEYEKHFLMSDGSYQAVVYSYPVHELVDGVWVEIESTNQNARGDVSPGSAQTNILDNFVWENHGVQNSDGVRLYIGNRSGYECQAYIQFATMPTIPTGSTITNATMTLNIVSGTSTANAAKAYQVTEKDWTSSTLQWSNKPAATVLLAENISHNNKTKYQFSCLEAVQHWYTNDPTGQNQNYGIMVCYQNPNIADYNSVYSADCTDATMRPSMTISYAQSGGSLDVLEGETLALSVTRASGTVTWASDNTFVATVDENGVVSGLKAGKAIITAYIDGSEYMRYTANVYIEDGVYRIRNNAGLFLGTYGGTSENTPVKLLDYANSGTEMINQLWKVTYLGSGYYSIRTLHKVNMGMRADGTIGSSVDIVRFGMVDALASVSVYNRWGIERSADGYTCYLNHIGTRNLGLKADGTIPSNGMGVTIENNPGTEVFEWSFQQVTGVFLHDIYGDPRDITDTITKEVEMGGIYSPFQMGVCVTSSNVDIAWSSDNTDISVDADGNVTAGSRGVANIKATFTVDDVQRTLNVEVTSIETVYVKNFYDSTYSGNTEKISKISTAVYFLNDVYYEEFHLKFVMDGSPVQYEDAGVDICPNGENACDSTCGTSCLTHHKNIFRIASELYYNYFERNHIVVMWSDSDENAFCDSASALHSTTGAYAAVAWFDDQPLPVIQVFRNDPSNEVESMAINLAHEVAHTLGLKEIYLNEYGDDEVLYVTEKDVIVTSHIAYDAANGCIMKYFASNSPSTLYLDVTNWGVPALCDYCIEKLHTEAIKGRDLYES